MHSFPRLSRMPVLCSASVSFFFFNDTATTEIYTLPYTTLFRSDVLPGIGFGHRNIGLEPDCFESCHGLGAAGDEDRFFQCLDDFGQRIAGLQHLEEGFGPNACHQNEDVDLMENEFHAEPEDGPVVLKRDGNLADGRCDERLPRVALNQSAHLRRHATLERQHSQAVKISWKRLRRWV